MTRRTVAQDIELCGYLLLGALLLAGVALPIGRAAGWW